MAKKLNVGVDLDKLADERRIYQLINQSINLLKSLHCIGNAEVKRGFSESGKSVTDDRIRLSEASINGSHASVCCPSND